MGDVRNQPHGGQNDHHYPLVPCSWIIPQVQKRIQTTDPSLVDFREDTGFCLYPGDSRGSGLDFSAFHGGEEHAGQSGRSASTSRYAFKPLDAPNGSVTVRVEYRRGVDSKVCTNIPTCVCMCVCVYISSHRFLTAVYVFHISLGSTQEGVSFFRPLPDGHFSFASQQPVLPCGLGKSTSFVAFPLQIILVSRNFNSQLCLLLVYGVEVTYPTFDRASFNGSYFPPGLPIWACEYIKFQCRAQHDDFSHTRLRSTRL